MRNARAGSFAVPCPPPIKGNTVLTQVRGAGTASVWPCRDHMSTGPPRHPCSFDRQGPPRCPALHCCSVRGVVQLTCHSSHCSPATTPASSPATLLSLVHLYSYRSQSHLCKRRSRQVTPPPKSTQWPSITPRIIQGWWPSCQVPVWPVPSYISAHLSHHVSSAFSSLDALTALQLLEGTRSCLAWGPLPWPSPRPCPLCPLNAHMALPYFLRVRVPVLARREALATALSN